MKKLYIIICENPELPAPLYYSGRTGTLISRSPEIRKAVTFESKGGAENILRVIEDCKRAEGSDDTTYRIIELPEEARKKEPPKAAVREKNRISPEEASRLSWQPTGDKIGGMLLFTAINGNRTEYAYKDETDGLMRLLGSNGAEAVAAFCKKGANRLIAKASAEGRGGNGV